MRADGGLKQGAKVHGEAGGTAADGVWPGGGQAEAELWPGSANGFSVEKRVVGKHLVARRYALV